MSPFKCIDLPQEARHAEHDVRELVAVFEERDSPSWVYSAQYIAWQRFIWSCLKECCDQTQEVYGPAPKAISSMRAVEDLVRNGVPPERILGMFRLLFT